MYLVPILGAALALAVLWRGMPQRRHPAPAPIEARASDTDPPAEAT